jgi:hypothetical protein
MRREIGNRRQVGRSDTRHDQQGPQAWGRVLHDDDLVQAIMERVLERGTLLRLDGPSVRTLHVNLDEAMKEDSDQHADLIRISGHSWSEFPEPTSANAPYGKSTLTAPLPQRWVVSARGRTEGTWMSVSIRGSAERAARLHRGSRGC